MHSNAHGNLSGIQKEKILRILDFSQLEDKEVQNVALDSCLRIKDNAWKVLIYDKLGQRIISPLLKVNELRDQGVTVNLSLEAERQCIPGVPAIYIVEPNKENVIKIANDIQKNLYEDIQIHFLRPCPRPVLELLATSLVSLNLPEIPITKLFDQHLDYVCLDERLFSLEMKNSYYTLKNPNTAEVEINNYIDGIATSLHSVFATLKQIPYIKYQPKSVGEAVARRLHAAIENTILSTTADGVFSSSMSQHAGPESRPLLILVDRSIDVTTMVSHQWTYASLVYDMFDVSINRIAYTDKKTKKIQYYDIDSDDFFWKKNSSLTLWEVTYNLNNDITECKAAFDDIKKNYNIDPGDEIDVKTLAPNTSALISAMKQVPLITERKRILDMHMKIATRILESVNERGLDLLFTLEESTPKQTFSAIMKTISDPKLQPGDKLRLFIVYYLSNKDESSAEVQKFEAALKDAGCDTEPLRYLREVRKLTQLSTLRGAPSPPNSQHSILGKFSNIGSKISDHLRESGVSSHIENLLSNIRRFLPISKSLPITRIVESLSENKSNFVTDQEYHVLDPKIISSSLDASPYEANSAALVECFSNVVIFVIGGGNMIEYQNTMELIKDSPMKNLIYGATEIVSPQNFLRQLHALGAEKK